MDKSNLTYFEKNFILVNKIHPSGCWYVDSETNLDEILDVNIDKIRVGDIKRLQIFIQDDISYTIDSISTCKPDSSNKKLNFNAVNNDLNKKINLVYPENYLLDLDFKSNIIVK